MTYETHKQLTDYLIRKATIVPKRRRATKPTYGSKLRRLKAKKERDSL